MRLGLLIFCRIQSPELSLGVSVVSTNHNGICCVVFPHPVGLIGGLLLFLVGGYYLADAGYMDMPGYMTPFRNTMYHMNDFRGVDLHWLQREENFNYIHAKLRNVIERRFGGLKERWHILKRGAVLLEEEAGYDNHFMLCIRKLLVAA